MKNKERIKVLLDNYIQEVISPNVNETRTNMGLDPIIFSVHDILEGSFTPKIIHVFLDTEPILKKKSGLKPHVIMMMDRVQKDIQDFFKMLSLNFKIKVHWNKRPIFNNATLSADH